MRTRLLLALSWLFSAATAEAAIEEQRAPQAPPPEAPPPQPVLTRAPELVRFVNAEYPPARLAAGEPGEAVLLIDIDAAGLVERVEVVSATAPEFGQAALVAASQFVFSPAEIDGKPSAIRIEYRYAFVPAVEEPDAIAGEPKKSGAEAELPVVFSGLVREAGNRKPVAGASILVDGRPAGETASDGSFGLRGILPGKHEVRVRSQFHEEYKVEEELGEGERLEVKYYLLRVGRDPYETFVISKSEQREASKVQLDRGEVSKIPGTFGDPVRVIENLPGMARVPGGLGGALLVRGARPQDSAVFLDGVQIPLIFHFGGLTAVVNAEFLERIDFFPGGFGARYGNATAGVVDVVSRELDCDVWRGVGEINIIHSAAFTCVPLGEWTLSAAGRRSYADLWLPRLLEALPRDEDEGFTTASPVYWDYQVKAGRSFPNQRLDFFAFGSDDRLKIVRSGSTEDINFDVGLHLTFHRLMARHRYDFGGGTTLTSSLTPGYDRNEFSGESRDLDAESNFSVPIYSVYWREDFTHPINDWLRLNAGVDDSFGTAYLKITAPVPTELRSFPAPFFDFTDMDSFQARLSGVYQAYWAELQLQPVQQLKLTGGLRVERFDFHKTHANGLGPRFNGRYEVLDGTTVKASWGIFNKLPDPPYLVPSVGNPKLEPEHAQHFIAGVEQKITEVINVDLTGFYNLRRNLVSPSNTVTYKDGKAVEQIWSNEGLGHSYGLELLVRHLHTADGAFFGWIAYTLSRSVQQDRREDVTAAVQQANGNAIEVPNARAATEYLVEWDQTHILTVVGQWTLPYGLEAGFRFRLVSGNPFTPLDQGVSQYDADQDRYDIDLTNVPRNSERMPTFHQLDVRVDKTFTYDLWTLTLYLELLNAYNASNVEAIQYDYRYRERAELTLLPIIPNIGVRGEF